MIKILLVLSSFAIWLQVYLAKVSDYDDNYGYIISGLLYSVVLSTLWIVFFARKKDLFNKHKLFYFLFLVFNSPFSICIFVYFYSLIFGRFFYL
jgi:hypothetical protein